MQNALRYFSRNIPTRNVAEETFPVHIIGIDLSGPTNIADTALTHFRCKKASLHQGQLLRGLDDTDLYNHVQGVLKNGAAVVGIDAPLSYNPGGGDRDAERELRKIASAAGLPSGTIMPPTMTRMVYLTLRGMAVARALQQLTTNRLHIIETHPASVLALHGGPPDAVRSMKRSADARRTVAAWLRAKGMEAPFLTRDLNDHELCACAAAMGAWKWHEGSCLWHHPAKPPLHPFPCAC